MIKGLIDGADEGVLKLSFLKNELKSLPHHSQLSDFGSIGFLHFGHFINKLLF